MSKLELMVEGFIDAVDRMEEEANRGPGGQQVGFHGDFAGILRVPSARSRLRWWANAMREAKADDARRLAALEKCVEVLRFAVDVGIPEMAEQLAEIDGVPNEIDDARQFAFDARTALAALDEKGGGG